MRTTSLVLGFLALALAGTCASAQQKAAKPAAAREPGLYITWQTDHGNITCKLFENEAPLTVRRVVGLALGKIAYVDPATKQVVRKRLYDGLIFHRVIPQFMIETGDPLGTGMGGPEGPGFPFRDEILPSLKFDAPGRLAMANSGPNTNRSQLFITEGPAPWLNGKHTIFGQCGNTDVVQVIARVPRDRNDRPLTPARLKKVVTDRVGPAPPNPPEAGPPRRSSPKPSAAAPPKS